jgi:hypothetical protein
VAEEIRLRCYRVVPRKPVLVVGDGVLVARVPAYFGRHRWTIPLDQVAVVAELAPEEAELGSDAFFVRGLELPYLFTTGPATEPNLVVVFAEAQRVPPVRLVVAQRVIDIGWFGSRSARGEVLDGVALRVVDPDAARAVLVRAGVEVVDEPIAWLAERRQVTWDPVVIEEVEGQLRWARGASWAALALYAVAFALLVAGPDPLTVPWVVLLVAVVLAGVAVRERVRWLDPRRRPA